MKFSVKVGNGPVNKWLNFGGDHGLDKGILFRICHYWEVWKVVNKHQFTLINKHPFIMIHQMATLVRRAFAEVCTVPVLLVGRPFVKWFALCYRIVVCLSCL